MIWRKALLMQWREARLNGAIRKIFISFIMNELELIHQCAKNISYIKR